MLGRRRPLARAAVIGGGAYALGKRRARQENDQQAYYEDQVQQAQEPQGLTDGDLRELEKLAQLKEQGILTEAEFTEQKQRILAG